MATPIELYNEHETLKDAGEYAQAKAKLEESIALDDGFVMGHLGLAVVCGLLDEHDKAVHHAQRACDLEPSEAFNFTAMSVTCQRASVKADNAADNARLIQMAEDAMAKSHMLEGRG